jgi:transposase
MSIALRIKRVCNHAARDQCFTVVVESTGSYWIPVWIVFREQLAVIVANPEHVKARRGEKTDPEDSRRRSKKKRRRLRNLRLVAFAIS